MLVQDLLLLAFCLVDDRLKNLGPGSPRQRGPGPGADQTYLLGFSDGSGGLVWGEWPSNSEEWQGDEGAVEVDFRADGTVMSASFKEASPYSPGTRSRAGGDERTEASEHQR